MTKPTDVPDLLPIESTRAVAWWATFPTIHVFEQTIGSSKYFAGRQVFESPNGAPVDTCWREGDQLQGIQKFGLTGGGWWVGYYFFDNRWHYDFVGWSPAYIDYYRGQMRTPCGASVPQAMKAYTRDTLGSQTYFTDNLELSLPDNTWVGVARDGVWAWRTWP